MAAAPLVRRAVPAVTGEREALTHGTFVEAVVRGVVLGLDHDSLDYRTYQLRGNLAQVQANIESGLVPHGYSAIDCRRVLD